MVHHCASHLQDSEKGIPELVLDTRISNNCNKPNPTHLKAHNQKDSEIGIPEVKKPELRIHEFIHNIRTSYKQDSDIGIPESAHQPETSHHKTDIQHEPQTISIHKSTQNSLNSDHLDNPDNSSHTTNLQDSEIGIPEGTQTPITSHQQDSETGALEMHLQKGIHEKPHKRLPYLKDSRRGIQETKTTNLNQVKYSSKTMPITTTPLIKDVIKPKTNYSIIP